MADRSNIEWCDSTFNPWEGCQHAGPGCDNCYAENRNARYAGGQAVNWGPGAPRRRTSVANWRKPVAWNLGADAFEREHGRRRRVFCASLADVFDNQVDPAWRADLFELIRKTPRLDWLLLTKRIGNAEAMIKAAIADLDIGYSVPFAAWPWPNVWLGATAVNQAEADRDIPKLLATPAHMRFLSIEPMLGPIDLTRIQVCGGDAEIYPLIGTTECVNDEGVPADDVPAVNWIIAGGESGPKARPMHPDWARSLRDQCTRPDVPFLFKQWGEWIEVDSGMAEPLVAREGDPEFNAELAKHDGFISLAGHFVTDPDDMVDGVAYRGLIRPGKKTAGRLLDGIEHNGFPIGPTP
ncbi:phage Gp37/Gp68 family protein [Paucibacter sp. R3-3]|uniref:Phage Gp37/Gp68 family protein n=1 Tax=Roseateles agri TaxID=3098619 RepID=A0ABU5DNM5_9BURK|nr:phage Gp37/Gp68 family protein [Paucibacter sp. R3-3]MDY0747333.1 phage Gp37/Gp68 family protein [Paucibacter sp. R3-3]